MRCENRGSSHEYFHLGLLYTRALVALVPPLQAPRSCCDYYVPHTTCLVVCWVSRPMAVSQVPAPRSHKPKGRQQPDRDSSFRFSGPGMWARLPGQRRADVRDTLASMESLLSSPTSAQSELCRLCGLAAATVLVMHGAQGCRCLCEGCKTSDPPTHCLVCGAPVTDLVSTAVGGPSHV